MSECGRRAGCGLGCAAAFLLAALFQLGCGAPPSPRPNILLISVDTLRADRIGAYGSDTARTPHIDRIAREGVVFENAMAPIPLTRPSHFSLLASLYPRDHGVVNNGFALPEEIVTVTQVLQEAGYETAGFTGASLLDTASGAGRGFEIFDFPEDTVRSAAAVIQLASDWLAERESDRPFFLWVHLFDPHMPYEPPAAWRPAGPARMAGRLPTVSWGDLSALAAESNGNLPRPAYQRALALYAGEVEHVDSSIGLLMAALDRPGQQGDTVVVFTADHGECFENGIFFNHSNCLFEPAVRIPLIIRHPPHFAGGERRTDVIENLDVAPTLLALAGLEVPAAFRGGDLRRVRPSEDQRAFIQHPLYPGDVEERFTRQRKLLARVMGEPVRPLVVEVPQEAVRTPNWKFVRTGDDEALFHLASDPGERRNRVQHEPEVAARLRAELDGWLSAVPLQLREAAPIHPKLLEHLRALGYAH